MDRLGRRLLDLEQFRQLGRVHAAQQQREGVVESEPAAAQLLIIGRLHIMMPP